jgi:hypothetical protein
MRYIVDFLCPESLSSEVFWRTHFERDSERWNLTQILSISEKKNAKGLIPTKFLFGIYPEWVNP